MERAFRTRDQSLSLLAIRSIDSHKWPVPVIIDVTRLRQQAARLTMGYKHG